MSIEQFKTINHGGKQTGKIIGGMAFSGNAISTDVGAGNTFVRIGAGAGVMHAAFVLIPELASGFEYFSIIGGPAVNTQALSLTKGTAVNLYLHWSIAMQNTSVNSLTMKFRVRLQPLVGAPSTIPSSIIGGPELVEGSVISSKTLVTLSTGDSIYLELSNVDATNPTQDVMVTSCVMMITE